MSWSDFHRLCPTEGGFVLAVRIAGEEIQKEKQRICQALIIILSEGVFLMLLTQVKCIIRENFVLLLEKPEESFTWMLMRTWKVTVSTRISSVCVTELEFHILTMGFHPFLLDVKTQQGPDLRGGWAREFCRILAPPSPMCHSTGVYAYMHTCVAFL